MTKLIVVFSRHKLEFSVLLWRINISEQTWCCDIWKACCNQRYGWCLFAQGSKTNKQGTFFPIENVWKHTKDILCSVWLKSVVLRLILKTIAIIWEFISMKYMSLGQNCYSSRFTFIVVNWSNSELDLMVQASLNVRKLKLMWKISGFVWATISAEYMYLRNYCRTLGTIFRFTFVVKHKSSPESDVMLFDILTFCLLCLVSSMKCLRPSD